VAVAVGNVIILSTRDRLSGEERQELLRKRKRKKWKERKKRKKRKKDPTMA